MIAANLAIEDISIGQSVSFERSFTEEDLNTFAELSGDYNPLHTDEAYAKTTPFGRKVVYGMLLGSLCSRLVGMHLPGRNCLYLSQTLLFKKPVFINDTVKVTGTIEAISLSTRVLHIAISIMNGDEEAVSGMAIVKVL